MHDFVQMYRHVHEKAREHVQSVFDLQLLLEDIKAKYMNLNNTKGNNVNDEQVDEVITANAIPILINEETDVFRINRLQTC